jgi:alkylated DNA repair dioxygenase AlkB
LKVSNTPVTQRRLLNDSAPDTANAELIYWADWLDQALADRWLRQLLGRHPVPRLLAWHGDAQAVYRYSGILHKPLPWTALLTEIRERVTSSLGQSFNAVLLNLYRDGQDSMGWHSDDEPELGSEPLLASLSLGGTRRFDLRRKGHTRIEQSLALTHGSLLVMGGQTQHHWQHQVAKTRRCCDVRLNLTFRTIQAVS